MLLASLKGHRPLVKIPLTMIFIKRGSFYLLNFQIRYNAITVFADLDGDKNVLTVSVIKKLFALRKKLGEINTGVAGHTSTWDKICSRQRVSRGGGGGYCPQEMERN